MRLLRAIGLVCGLTTMALAVHSWAIASTGAALGTDLGVAAVAPGELQVPSGLVLQASGMQPSGAPVSGELSLRNITGAPVRVRIRALPSTRALDGALALTVTSRGRRATLSRQWSPVLLTLGIGRRATLPLRARLLRAQQGLIADVALELRSDPAPPR
jgi:hypothetical protein